ncbi:MAG: hypothetical protein WHS77_06220 [Brevinematales bacterium]
MYKIIFLSLFLFNVCFANDDFIKIFQLFQERKFIEIVSNYSQEYIISNKDLITETGVFLYSKSLFAIEDYKNSLLTIESIEKQNEETRILKFFILLNLTNISLAKKELTNFRNPDKIFLTSLINFIENDIKNATNNLKLYIESEDDKNFNFEALLVDYFYNIKKGNFPKAFELILKKSLIDETIFLETKSKNSPFNDFLLYKKCDKLIQEEKKEEAKKILLELIKNSESSIIKNLASYEYQKLN